MDTRIQRTIASIGEWSFVEGDQYRETADISYQALRWEKPRRMVVVRERVRQGRDNWGKKLFEVPDYTYSAVLTNMDDDAVEVWRFYNGRADVENRIKELRYDFGADGFCLDSFFGTEAALKADRLPLQPRHPVQEARVPPYGVCRRYAGHGRKDDRGVLE